ncbi:hypothetical protein GCWU000342_01254 [Shuttleworthella satelles DSM 14600]|uniref:Uncharacterized protein n=1 Tax=Shuttleworthella satelles DSM 14600 TaxID=626523 RepID=C4GBF4_9FIRM|nr:hypothetical protein GCWU000342_01254 [Shuttleworthia satelles DSM 14600]
MRIPDLIFSPLQSIEHMLRKCFIRIPCHEKISRLPKQAGSTGS